MIDPFNWKPNFSSFKDNIIEDDIIPDELLEGIQNKIDTHCPKNYTSYKSSANTGYSRSCNDTGGNSECNCDINGNHCMPANDNNNTCKNIFGQDADACTGEKHKGGYICTSNEARK